MLDQDANVLILHAMKETETYMDLLIQFSKIQLQYNAGKRTSLFSFKSKDLTPKHTSFSMIKMSMELD